MIPPPRIFSIIPLVHFLQLTAIAWATPVNQNRTLAGPLDTASDVTAPLPARVVYDFPTATWIENLAVRHNGQIIATEITKPRIYQVDPFGPPNAILVHEFQGASSILGIVEASRDVFYVCSGNFSLRTFEVLGPSFIFKVDLRQFSPDQPGSAQVSKIATLPQALILNGLTFLGGNSSLLLAGDSALGVIFSVDIETGDSRVAINSTYTRTSGSSRTGVNGLKFYDNFLYLANNGQQTLVKVPINTKGEATGNYTILTQGDFQPDDFALDACGDAYVATSQSGREGLAFVPREGGAVSYIAGAAGPTSAAFGRTPFDRSVLYLGTSGGSSTYQSGQPVTVSGKIVKVEVGRSGPMR